MNTAFNLDPFEDIPKKKLEADVEKIVYGFLKEKISSGKMAIVDW